MKAMKVFASIPVKSTKAEQQYQHGIINVEAIRNERQNAHGAHDLTEEDKKCNNGFRFRFSYFYTEPMRSCTTGFQEKFHISKRACKCTERMCTDCCMCIFV